MNKHLFLGRLFIMLGLVSIDRLNLKRSQAACVVSVEMSPFADVIHGPTFPLNTTPISRVQELFLLPHQPTAACGFGSLLVTFERQSYAAHTLSHPIQFPGFPPTL